MSRFIRAAVRDERLQAKIAFAIVWLFLAGIVVLSPIPGALH